MSKKVQTLFENRNAIATGTRTSMSRRSKSRCGRDFRPLLPMMFSQSHCPSVSQWACRLDTQGERQARSAPGRAVLYGWGIS